MLQGPQKINQGSGFDVVLCTSVKTGTSMTVVSTGHFSVTAEF